MIIYIRIFSFRNTRIAVLSFEEYPNLSSLIYLIIKNLYFLFCGRKDLPTVYASLIGMRHCRVMNCLIVLKAGYEHKLYSFLYDSGASVYPICLFVDS